MITADEIKESFKSVKRNLINAHDSISGVADFMEMRLTTEYDRASSKEYGTVCRVLGILEEQIASISNQLENPGADDPWSQVDLTPENNLFLTPEEFGRRGQFYFGLSAFEGFEFTDAFAGECDTVCGVDDAVEDGIRHCGVADGVVPVQFGEL